MPTPKLSSLIRDEHLRMISKTNEGKKGAIKETVNRLVKEEFESMMKEAEERSESIAKKLEGLRNALIKDGKLALGQRDTRGSLFTVGTPERRIPIQTVSELLDIPINELVLHFLNGHRIHEGLELVEYRVGNVYFYATPEKNTEVK